MSKMRFFLWPQKGTDADRVADQSLLVDPALRSRYPVRPAKGIVGVLRVLVPILILQLAFGLVYSWGAVVPAVRAESHWPPLLVSAVFSSGPLGYAIGMAISGRLAEFLPARRLCWASLGLMGSGFAVAFLFPTGLTFILFYAIIGLGLGGAVAMTGSLVAGTSIFPTRVGTIGGALTGSYALAAVVEVPLVSRLAASYGWLTALRSVGSGVALLAACTLLFMPAIPPARRIQVGRNVTPVLTLIRRDAIRVGFLLEVTASPLGSYAFVAVASYAHSLHLLLWVVTLAVTAVAVGNSIGRLVCGSASDYFGITRVFIAIYAVNLLSALLFNLPGSEIVVLLGALTAGMGFGGPAGVLSRLAAVSAPDAPNTAFGLLFSGFALGAVTGPLLGAATGGSALSWMVLGGIAMIGLLILTVYTIVQKRRAHG